MNWRIFRFKVTWKEPVFADNVKIVHVMASKMPGQFLAEGRHDVLYQVNIESINFYLRKLRTVSRLKNKDQMDVLQFLKTLVQRRKWRPNVRSDSFCLEFVAISIRGFIF